MLRQQAQQERGLVAVGESATDVVMRTCSKDKAPAVSRRAAFCRKDNDVVRTETLPRKHAAAGTARLSWLHICNDVRHGKHTLYRMADSFLVHSSVSRSRQVGQKVEEPQRRAPSSHSNPPATFSRKATRRQRSRRRLRKAALAQRASRTWRRAQADSKKKQQKQNPSPLGSCLSPQDEQLMRQWVRRQQHNSREKLQRRQADRLEDRERRRKKRQVHQEGCLVQRR